MKQPGAANEAGLKMGGALAAVASMHKQASQLLVDCDRLFPDRDSVTGSTATRELTWSYNAWFWMAEAVYRYWRNSDEVDLSVVGLSILLFPYDRSLLSKLEQPLVVAGRIQYANKEAIEESGQAWDLWRAALRWHGDLPAFNEVIRCNLDDAQQKRIHLLDMIVIPLYSIESLDDIRDLFERLDVSTTEPGAPLYE